LCAVTSFSHLKVSLEIILYESVKSILILFILSVLEIEPKGFCMLDKCFTTELHPQLCYFFNSCIIFHAEYCPITLFNRFLLVGASYISDTQRQPCVFVIWPVCEYSMTMEDIDHCKWNC
jgi:hypothetical protein